MELQWNEQDPANVLDNVTDFRLNHTETASLTPENIWWSALVVLDGTPVSEFYESLVQSFDYSFLIPEDHAWDDGLYPGEEHILTVYAQASVMRAMNTVDNPYGVASINLGSIINAPELGVEKMVTSDGTAPEEDTFPEGTVTMAMIDDGIAFGHNQFRSGLCSTRIEAMYIMDAVEPGSGDIGIKLNKRKIDRLLEKHTYSGLLDEESFYREAGSINRFKNFFSTTSFRRSHGTHVMSLAAGYGMEDAPNNRPIIGVQLPTRVTEDTSGSNLAPSLRSAIRYILRQSQKIRIGGPDGPIAPLVVNFSYGNFAGPHDGTGLIARIIDRELKSTPDQEIRVILPAGNSNLARCHAAVSFEDTAGASDRVKLDLRVYPDDYTCNYVQMWMPYSGQTPPPNFVKVRVTPPNSTQSMAVDATLGSRQVLRNENGEVVAQLAYEMEPAPTKRGLITLSVNPTASQTPSIKLAPSGLWEMEFERVDIADDDYVEVRIERDETLPGYPPFGRQAYFDNACYVRFDEFGAPLSVDPPDSDCPIRRSGTLSGFASGKLPLVVAAFTQSNGLLSDYSSAGPISAMRNRTVPNRVGPDASARADDSPVLYGVLAAGTRSGSMVRMNGTSVSAPLVARCVGDGLGANEPADRAWLAAKAAASDPTFPQPKPADTRTGGGRLRLPYPFSPGSAEL